MRIPEEGYAELSFKEAKTLLGEADNATPEQLRKGLHARGFSVVSYIANLDPVTDIPFIDTAATVREQRVVYEVQFGVLPRTLLAELSKTSFPR